MWTIVPPEDALSTHMLISLRIAEMSDAERQNQLADLKAYVRQLEEENKTLRGVILALQQELRELRPAETIYLCQHAECRGHATADEVCVP